jgi:hypothetical protein
MFPSMRRRTLFIAIISAGLFPSNRPLNGQQQEPWFGKWNLNVAQSADKPDSPRYKRVTLHIEPWGDGLKVTYDMVGTRGGITHLEWNGRFDGKDYPVQGVDYVLTNAYRRIDDWTYEIVVKVDSAVVATSKVSVSPDRKTMRVTTEERLPNGQTVTTTAIYEK